VLLISNILTNLTELVCCCLVRNDSQWDGWNVETWSWEGVGPALLWWPGTWTLQGCGPARGQL